MANLQHVYMSQMAWAAALWHVSPRGPVKEGSEMEKGALSLQSLESRKGQDAATRSVRCLSPTRDKLFFPLLCRPCWIQDSGSVVLYGEQGSCGAMEGLTWLLVVMLLSQQCSAPLWRAQALLHPLSYLFIDLRTNLIASVSLGQINDMRKRACTNDF